MIPVGKFCRKSHTCDSGNIVGSGTHILLLSASIDHGSQADLLIHVKESNSLRSVNLVTGYREHIDILLLGTYGQFSVGLDCICVEPGVGITYLNQLSYFFHRLYGTDLIVHMHDGNKDGIMSYGSSQVIEIYMSFTVYRKISDLVSKFCQCIQRLVDGCMLNLGRYDVHSLLTLCKSRSEDGCIV